MIAALLGVTGMVTYHMNSKAASGLTDLSRRRRSTSTASEPVGGYNYGASDEFQTDAGGGYHGEGGDYDAQVTRTRDDDGQVHG